MDFKKLETHIKTTDENFDKDGFLQISTETFTQNGNTIASTPKDINKNQKFHSKLTPIITKNVSNKEGNILESTVNSQIHDDNHTDTPHTTKTFKLHLEFTVKVSPIKVFRKVLICVRTVVRLKHISENIQMYGTSSNLFDITTRDRGAVKSFLYPLVEQENLKNSDDISNLPFPLIHPKGKIMSFWSPIVVILLIYTTTLMPYTLVFYDMEDTWDDSWFVFQNVVDILFWTDLTINMFSSYYNDEGTLVTDRKKVIMTYVKTWFVIDLMACIPFDLIENALSGDSSNTKKIQLVRLSKLPRLYRIIKLAKVFKIFQFITHNSIIMDFFELNSGLMRLVTLLVSVMILVHLMGCFWYYEAKLDDFQPDTWVARNNMIDSDNLSLYLMSIYYALTTLATVGYGDISSRTNTEIITSIGWMLVGVGFYSFTIGILSSVLATIDTKSIKLNKKISTMNEFCNEMKINNSLKARLRKTLEYNSQKNSFLWTEKTNVFNDLPLNLRYEIAMSVNKKVMSEILFFRDCDDKYFVVRTVPLLKPLFIEERELIWMVGSNPDAIYFLVTGRVNYVSQYNVKRKYLSHERKKEEDKKYFIFKSMVASSYFGEIEILFKRRRLIPLILEYSNKIKNIKLREYSVISEVDSEVYYLSRNDFETVLVKEFPHIVEKMKILARKRSKIDKTAVKEISGILRAAREFSQDHIVMSESQKIDISKSESHFSKRESFNLKNNKILPIIDRSQKNEEKKIDYYPNLQKKKNSVINEPNQIPEIKECFEEDSVGQDIYQNTGGSSESEMHSNDDVNQISKDSSSKNSDKISLNEEGIDQKNSNLNLNDFYNLNQKIEENEKIQNVLEENINHLQDEMTDLLNLFNSNT